MLPYSNVASALKECLHLISFITGSVSCRNRKGTHSSRRRSSFIITPNGDCHKTTLEYVLPLLLLPLLLGRQGLLTAWVIYLYPLDSILRHLRLTWSTSSPKLWITLTHGIDRLESKFLSSSSANLINQILFFTLTDKCLGTDRRTSLYTLIFYNFVAYIVQYLKELGLRGEETWASVSISNSTNVRHLAMSATKLVLEWTKMVTFLATLIAFILVVQLDSFTRNLPPLKYTFLTLTYYLLMEDKLKISGQYFRNELTIDHIQGLEFLYFQVLKNGITLLFNIILIVPAFRSNPKLCSIVLYNNVYLQYKIIRKNMVSINTEWELISSFREAHANEVQDLDDVCAVCLNPLKRLVRVTKCRHFFHANCLRLYLKESRLDSCPLCKRTL